jgi:hypothetical protein
MGGEFKIASAESRKTFKEFLPGKGSSTKEKPRRRKPAGF